MYGNKQKERKMYQNDDVDDVPSESRIDVDCTVKNDDDDDEDYTTEEKKKEEKPKLLEKQTVKEK